MGCKKIKQEEEKISGRIHFMKNATLASFKLKLRITRHNEGDKEVGVLTEFAGLEIEGIETRRTRNGG